MINLSVFSLSLSTLDENSFFFFLLIMSSFFFFFFLITSSIFSFFEFLFSSFSINKKKLQKEKFREHLVFRDSFGFLISGLVWFGLVWDGFSLEYR